MLLLIHNLKKMMIKRQNLNHLTTIRNQVISLLQRKLQKLQRKVLKKGRKVTSLRTKRRQLKQKKIYPITLHRFKPMQELNYTVQGCSQTHALAIKKLQLNYSKLRKMIKISKNQYQQIVNISIIKTVWASCSRTSQKEITKYNSKNTHLVLTLSTSLLCCTLTNILNWQIQKNQKLKNQRQKIKRRRKTLVGLVPKLSRPQMKRNQQRSILLRQVIKTPMRRE